MSSIDGNGTGHSNSNTLTDCPPYPDYPAGANLDANIRETRNQYLTWLKTAVPGADPFATTNAFIIWFVGKVKPGGDWDYKRLNTPDRNYEAFGNFHYGAVGGAAEFTLDQLLKAAGLVQQWAGDEKGDGGSANIINALTGKGGEPPFGDQVRDQERIKTGYNYYRQKFYWQACK